MEWKLEWSFDGWVVAVTMRVGQVRGTSIVRGCASRELHQRPEHTISTFAAI